MGARVVTFALSLLFGVFSPVWAQGVGAIGGTVMDASGAVLPGVTVTLSAPGVIGGNQTTVTDAQGAYQFTRLVPGRYSVKTELQGFQTFVQENIDVNADRTSRADLKLAVGAVAETVTVSGESPLLDTTSALRQTVMERQVLDTLPTANDIWSIARIIPGVTLTKIDIGGVEMLAQSTAFVHGSLSDEKGYYIDGMDLNSYTSGTSINFYPDTFSAQEVNYQAGQSPAEYRLGGVVVNLVSKTGTNAFRGTAMFSGSNSSLRSNNVSSTLRQQLLAGVPANVLAINPNIDPGGDIDRLYDSAITYSGPVVRDRVWFVATAKLGESNTYKVGSYNADGTQLLSDNRLIVLSGKLSWAMAPSSQLHFMHSWVEKGRYHVAGGPTVTEFFDTQASLYNNSRNHFMLSRWTHVVSSQMVLDVAASTMFGQNNQKPQKEVPADAISRFDAVTRINTVAAATYSIQEGQRTNVASSLSYVAGSHDFKVGYQYIRNDGNGGGTSTSGMRAVYRNGAPDSVNTYNTPTKFQIVVDQHALFVQDKWRPVRKLTLNLGLRFETSYGWRPAECQVQTQFIAAQCFPEQRGVPDFKGLVPRLSAIYDLFGDGRTALKFSANQYRVPADRGFAEVVNPIRLANDTRSWTDANSDRIPQFSELGPSTGFSVGTTNRYAPDIKWPYDTEIAAQIDRQLPGPMVVSAGYFYRGHRNMIGQRNLAVPRESYTPLQVTEVTSGRQVTVYNQDPATRSRFDVVYDNDAVLDTSFHGVDLTAEKRMSNRWMLMGSLSLGKNDTDIYNGSDLNNPNLTFRRGPAAQHVPYFLKVAGAFELPYRLSLGINGQRFAGWPDTNTVRVSSNTVRLTQVNQNIVIEPRGTTDLPAVTTIDLNVRKVLTRGGLRFEPRMDIFNLFNASAITQRITQLGPAYGNAIEILGARLVKFGMNMGW